MRGLDALCWPEHRQMELLELLAWRSGRARPPGGGGSPLDDIDLHGVHTAYEDVPGLVQGAAPALLAVHGPGDAMRLLGLLAGPDLLGRVRLLSPDGGVARVPAREVVAALRAPVEGGHRASVDALLERAGLAPRRRAAARERLLGERLRGHPLGGGTLVRAAPHGPWWAALWESGVLGPALRAVAGRALGSVLLVLGWVIIGQGALAGRVAPGWVTGWALLLLTSLLVATWTGWQQGRAALRAGTWVKAALLRGAMREDPGAYRAGGTGGSLARVQESQAIEDLIVSGGLSGLLSLADLAAAAWVLTRVPEGWPLLALVALATGGAAAGALRLRRLQGDWTAARRGLTALLVERMLGHRTRLAQAPPARWHEGEDEALSAYHASSQRLDDHRLALGLGLTGGFGALGVALIGLAFTLGEARTEALAVVAGGFLLASTALMNLSASFDGLAAAAISWREVGPLLRGARRAPRRGLPVHAASASAPGDLLVRAEGLRFGWPGRRPVLDALDLTLRVGDRALLTGTSGGGKSTLAALLTGLREPDGGLLMLCGLDRHSLGEERWRRLAVAAPQFHENHVFENTLAFNLLLGREWPPDPADLDEARDLCVELGLGPLLERMPAGLHQVVGASGWQLSHGERSRVFLARALLQRAALVVLDESFAALDPETFTRCLDVSLRRAPTLVVIAHP